VATNDIIDRTDAGALIPEKERNEILKGLPAASAALSLGRKVSMSTKRERTPVLSALPEAYWLSSDTGLKQTTQAQWENKYLEAEEMAVIVPIPDAVADDSMIDIFGEVRPLLVEAIGAKFDAAVLFDVDNPFDEDAIVTGATAAGNVVERGSVDWTSGKSDIGSDIGGEGGLMNLVEEDGFNVNGFAARTRIKSRLRGLRDENGDVIFQPSLTTGTPASLYGEPVIYGDQNGAWDTDVDVIGGDWSKLVVGIRQDITFKIFSEGVISDNSGNVVLNLMQQDSKALRVVVRYGYAVANPINRQNRVEDDRYPFAVLGDFAS
jgi:HK97 family phage major capsid protein